MEGRKEVGKGGVVNVKGVKGRFEREESGNERRVHPYGGQNSEQTITMAATMAPWTLRKDIVAVIVELMASPAHDRKERLWRRFLGRERARERQEKGM